MSFLRHTEIYRSDMFIALTPGVSAASRWSAPGPGKKTRRKERALAHRSRRVPAGYSSIGLLASIARLRFTGNPIIKCWTDRREEFIIER